MADGQPERQREHPEKARRTLPAPPKRDADKGCHGEGRQGADVRGGGLCPEGGGKPERSTSHHGGGGRSALSTHCARQDKQGSSSAQGAEQVHAPSRVPYRHEERDRLAQDGIQSISRRVSDAQHRAGQLELAGIRWQQTGGEGGDVERQGGEQYRDLGPRTSGTLDVRHQSDSCGEYQHSERGGC